MICKGQRAFESKMDASSEAVRLTHRHRLAYKNSGVRCRIVAYICPLCRKWHLREEIIRNTRKEKEIVDV